MARKDIEEHVTSLCKWRIVQCGHCHEAHAKCLDKVSTLVSVGSVWVLSINTKFLKTSVD